MKRTSLRETGGYGGRIRASGSVSGDATEKWRSKLLAGCGGSQEIQSDLTPQVAALEQECTTVFFSEKFSSFPHASNAVDLPSDQDLQFVQIGSDEEGMPEQHFSIGRDGRPFEE